MYYITADATCDLPYEYSGMENFVRLPMAYSIGDREYMHGRADSLTFDEFYSAMRGGAMPITSGVTPNTAEEYWTPILEAGSDILHIGFSSGLSSSYRNCLTAAEEMRKKYKERKIIVIDSLAAGIGEAQLVVRADNNRRASMSLEDNALDIEAAKFNNCHYFMVNDLSHLKRGGRISPLAAFVGTAIQLKPLLNVNETGHLVTIDKAISRRMALKHLFHKIISKLDEHTSIIFVSHADAPADAEFIRQRLIEYNPSLRIFTNRVGAILVSHTGMELMGVTFIGQNREEHKII